MPMTLGQAVDAHDPYAFYITRGDGARIWDADGTTIAAPGPTTRPRRWPRSSP